MLHECKYVLGSLGNAVWGRILTSLPSCSGAGGWGRAWGTSYLSCWSCWLDNPAQQKLGKLSRWEGWVTHSAPSEPQLFSGWYASGYNFLGCDRHHHIHVHFRLTGWQAGRRELGTESVQGTTMAHEDAWAAGRKSLGAMGPCSVHWFLGSAPLSLLLILR